MVRALTIRQPWAWLIINGYKDIENRSWRTSYRGRLAIHAAVALDPDFGEETRRVQDEFGIRVPEPGALERGGIIGTVDVLDCVSTSESPWFSGPYGLVLTMPQQTEFVPLRGQLGLFSVDDQLIRMLPR